MTDTAAPTVEVYVSAGSNIRPEENLQLACRELHADFGELSLSSVYRNPAVGFAGDDFLNMVIGFRTAADPAAVKARMEEVHALAKRQRQADPFSPRTLDLDVLLYGDLVEQQLKLPHDDIEKYGFVLGPLAEIAPELRHPVSGKTIAELWSAFDNAAAPLTRVDCDFKLDA
ncbi:MAG: 2-amino-4-hydroxy-6-hydroxymethyldihydropteridine diphosphokinase [Gammaproteobacteria bacterium]|jgi:2-amino-4-hydroxy-6-hydroxymethyldihydropteridine diphosphokinase|nr:2-amino-4-hydroxy-6-hydroxymethyldihydropteridine diphosphokinase [Gammaproteobacteria bacterium]